MIRRVLTPPSEIPPPPFDGKNSLNKAPSAFFNELSQTEEPEELERQDASSLGSATGRVSSDTSFSLFSSCADSLSGQTSRRTVPKRFSRPPSNESHGDRIW